MNLTLVCYFLVLLIGWVKIQGAESALIKASLKSQDVSYDCIGTVIASHGCWSFLKGGFVVTSPSSFSILTLQVNIVLTLFFNTFNLTSSDYNITLIRGHY